MRRPAAAPRQALTGTGADFGDPGIPAASGKTSKSVNPYARARQACTHRARRNPARDRRGTGDGRGESSPHPRSGFDRKRPLARPEAAESRARASCGRPRPVSGGGAGRSPRPAQPRRRAPVATSPPCAGEGRLVGGAMVHDPIGTAPDTGTLSRLSGGQPRRFATGRGSEVPEPVRVRTSEAGPRRRARSNRKRGGRTAPRPRVRDCGSLTARQERL